MINDQKNMILAIGLSVLVIIGWQYFIGGPQLEKQRQEQQLKQKQAQQAQQAQQPGAVPQASQPGITLPSLDPSPRPDLAERVSVGKERIKGVIKGFLLGVGVGFVALMGLAMLSNAFGEDSAGYNVIIVLVLLCFLLPIILAVRGWHVGGRAAGVGKRPAA